MKMVSALLALLLAPAATQAQQISYDFDKTANFANFKTFAMRDGTKAGDTFVDDRLTAAIEAELAKKGLVKADTPDLFVAYHIAVDTTKDINAFTSGSGPYPWKWGASSGPTTTLRAGKIPIGTLVIDVVDAKKNEIVWRGIGVKQLDPRATPDRRERNIADGVQRVLRNFPPPRKK